MDDPATVEANKRLERMLASAPDRPENEQTRMWRKMKPMTPDLFSQFWEGGKQFAE